MLKFFIVIVILFLAVCIGIAFGLVWLFPAISFEIGVLIVAVGLSVILYIFINIIDAFPKIYLPPIDDDYIDDKVYDQHNLDQITHPRSTRSNRRKRR